MSAAPGWPHPRRPRSPEELSTAADGELAALARVDTEVFGVLYRRYRQQTYRMILHRLREPVDAEDVTAEVFVKALKAIDGYQSARAPFWGWLHRIALNAVVDHVRSRRPDSPWADLTEFEDARQDVEAKVVDRLEVDRARRAVSQLCPAQRTAVTLRVEHELPIAVIAGRMDRSEGAVKQLLNRGLGTVRRRLVEEPPPGSGDGEG